MSTLTDAELNRRVAEAMGWRVELGERYYWLYREGEEVSTENGLTEEQAWSRAPQFVTSLDAAMEAESFVASREGRLYEFRLKRAFNRWVAYSYGGTNGSTEYRSGFCDKPARAVCEWLLAWSEAQKGEVA